MVVFTLVGCSSVDKTLSCNATDWYEIGRQDGAKGHPLQAFESHEQSCVMDDSQAVKTLYWNGRNAGLVEYCHPANAFIVGRMGQAYKQVCPPILEKDFLAEFRRGQQARQLEQVNRELDQQIESIFHKLNRQALSTIEERDLRTQLNDLEKARAQNQRQLSEIDRSPASF